MSAKTRQDWHNLFADFSIRLSNRLAAAESDRERLKLIQQVRAALGESSGDQSGGIGEMENE